MKMKNRSDDEYITISIGQFIFGKRNLDYL